MPRNKRGGRAARARRAFSREALARVCAMPERDFAAAYGMQTVDCGPDDYFYHFRDNGARVLAVAHLDTVSRAHQRAAHYVDTEAGPVVFSRALDDRLGAYIILELLPALGITYDWLLTVGEEMGQSTADYFEPAKDYDWIIEFDRGGTDVVMYQYEDNGTREAVTAAGAMVGNGLFSDICYMEHLGVKGFNWGCGYRDYHGPRSHAYLEDTFAMVARYLRFHAQNKDRAMPHTPRTFAGQRGDRWCEVCSRAGTVDPVTMICAECLHCQDCFSEIRDCQCFNPDSDSQRAA